MDKGKAIINNYARLGKVTKALADDMKSLSVLMQEQQVKNLQDRVAEGDIPVKELDLLLEYIHRDFNDLKLMDSFWMQANDDIKSVITALQEKEYNTEQSLSKFWVDTLKIQRISTGLIRSKQNILMYKRFLQTNLEEYGNPLLIYWKKRGK